MEDDQFIFVVGAIQRVVQAETGEAHVLVDIRGRRVTAVVEEVGGVVNGLHAIRGEQVDLHGRVVVEAQVKELRLDGQVLSSPDRLIRAEPDVAVGIVVQALESRGQRDLTGFISLLGKGSGVLDQRGVVGHCIGADGPWCKPAQAGT